MLMLMPGVACRSDNPTDYLLIELNNDNVNHTCMRQRWETKQRTCFIYLSFVNILESSPKTFKAKVQNCKFVFVNNKPNTTPMNAS